MINISKISSIYKTKNTLEYDLDNRVLGLETMTDGGCPTGEFVVESVPPAFTFNHVVSPGEVGWVGFQIAFSS